ncbi:MAG: transcriptional repressor [Chloroflexi bacterium]|nr:transcriptional repressor [Chloroflexota bacterium]
MEEALRELGYRLTPQRAMVLSAIEDSDDHISAEEIHALVSAKYPQVNISTVYRTLDLLKELGLVTETDLGGGRVSYHPAHRGRHHHLVCQKCGAAIELEDNLLTPLKEALQQRYGFRADLRHLAIFGRCARCGQ